MLTSNILNKVEKPTNGNVCKNSVLAKNKYKRLVLTPPFVLS